MMVFRFCPGMTVGINFSMLDSDHSCRAVGLLGWGFSGADGLARNDKGMAVIIKL